MQSDLGRALCLALSLAFSVGTARAQAPAPATIQQITELSLGIGEQVALPAQGVKSYSEGSRSIIDVRLTGDASRFVVVAMAQGVTTLLFLMVDGSERHDRITVGTPVDDGGTPSRTTAVDPLAEAAQANVRLDLYFVQIDRAYDHDIGMNVPATVAKATFNYAFDIPRAALISNSAIIGAELLPQLELAQTQGWAKVSRHVTVITSNGTQANFDSGGEFNVQVVNLALSESLAVAGLRSHSRDRHMTGVAGLSQIPIVGLLFGRQSAREQDIDNVVFIVPSVVEPMQRARAKEFLRDSLQKYEAYEGVTTTTAPPSTPPPAPRNGTPTRRQGAIDAAPRLRRSPLHRARRRPQPDAVAVGGGAHPVGS